MSETISTAVTELFNIKRPILLAGMNVAAGPELAAEVTNNGGLGVIGAWCWVYTKILESTIG